jgi:Flp pilus assembly protein TadG
MKRAVDERGASVLTLMIIVPVVLLAIFATVQAALVFHAQSIVEAAAQDGLRAAQAYNGSQADGMAAASTLLDQAGGDGLITGRSVQVDRGPAIARVEVRGQVITLVPGWSRSVSGIAEGPVERFVGEADR